MHGPVGLKRPYLYRDLFALCSTLRFLKIVEHPFRGDFAPGKLDFWMDFFHAGSASGLTRTKQLDRRPSQTDGTAATASCTQRA